MESCAHFEELISMELDGELSEEERKSLHTHLEICEACRGYRDMLQFMSGSLSDMVEPPAELHGSIMAEIGRISRKKTAKAKVFSLRAVPAAAVAALVIWAGVRAIPSVDMAAAEAAEAPRLMMAMDASEDAAAGTMDSVTEGVCEEECAPEEDGLSTSVVRSKPVPAADNEMETYLRAEVLLGEETADIPEREPDWRFLFRNGEVCDLWQEGENLIWKWGDADTQKAFLSPLPADDWTEHIA